MYENRLSPGSSVPLPGRCRSPARTHSELLCLAWIKPHGLVDLEGCMVDNCKPHSCVESESVNTCHLLCEIVGVTICSGVFSRAAVFGLRNLQCEREGLVFIQEQRSEGAQLNESMSEEGGYFRECHFFFPSHWHFSQISLCCLTPARQLHTLRILDQGAVASR